ncbi:MAG: hypothetical protein ACLQVD_21340 [Capsulimonadaceae bacterium]
MNEMITQEGLARPAFSFWVDSRIQADIESALAQVSGFVQRGRSIYADRSDRSEPRLVLPSPAEIGDLDSLVQSINCLSCC